MVSNSRQNLFERSCLGTRTHVNNMDVFEPGKG